MKRVFMSILVLLMFSSCTIPQPEPQTPDQPVSSEPGDGSGITPGVDLPANKFSLPQPGDENLERGLVFIDSTDVLLLESYPVQVNIQLKGSLPTPCHQARYIVQPADANNQVSIELYSLSDPDRICIQVLQDFESVISLGSFASGHYILTINGETSAEFDI